jgi:DNA-directed RNA polymerase III subunit RPC1
MVLPPPSILKPVELWTGKQVISFLINPYGASGVRVNFECKTKQYSGVYTVT